VASLMGGPLTGRCHSMCSLSAASATCHTLEAHASAALLLLRVRQVRSRCRTSLLIHPGCARCVATVELTCVFDYQSWP
jgi:hypothetical protein